VRNLDHVAQFTGWSRFVMWGVRNLDQVVSPRGWSRFVTPCSRRARRR
jgi:hypothetical protein